MLSGHGFVVVGVGVVVGGVLLLWSSIKILHDRCGFRGRWGVRGSSLRDGFRRRQRIDVVVVEV